MKERVKVIHIMSHQPPYHLYPNNKPPISWTRNDGKVFGLWDYEWADIILSKIIEHNDTQDISFEVWQPDLIADKVYAHKIKNGLIHKLFPTKKNITKLTLFSGKKELFSPDMIMQLKDLSKNYKVIVHVFFNSRFNTRILLKEFYKKTPFLFQFAHNPEFHPFFGVHSKRTLKNIVQNYILRSFYRRIENVFTSTNTTLAVNNNVNIYNHPNMSNIGVDFNKLECNLSKKEIRSNLNIGSNKTMFFASQRIVPEKQIDKLINTIAKLKGNDFIFYISGAGTEEYIVYLRKLVEDKNLIDKVVFTSYLSNNDLKLYYKAADFFISTSISEAGPDSIYKAIYYNIPVIATNTGIAFEFLENNKCGMIIDRFSESDWVNSLQMIVDKKIKIKTPDKQVVNDYFSWEKISNYYLNTYKDILY